MKVTKVPVQPLLPPPTFNIMDLTEEEAYKLHSILGQFTGDDPFTHALFVTLSQLLNYPQSQYQMTDHEHDHQCGAITLKKRKYFD